jgi:outer membrane protein TolC
VELGGKRGTRLSLANAGLLVAITSAEEEAWEVRWRVREAVGDRERAAEVWKASAAELTLTDSLLALMRARYGEGTVSRSELARMEADRQEAAMEVAARKREFEASSAALAARVGVPLGELERWTLTPDSVLHCADAPTRDSLEQVALEARRDLRRALAEYQLAEGHLRVEVANSWPNLALGPGLFFDHGVGKWTVALGLPSLPLNRNRGPILEADARRELAARRVAELQEQVLGEVTGAFSACRSSADEMATIDLGAARERVRLAEVGYQRSEIGQLEVMFARLELVRATRRFLETGNRLRVAGVALEHAVGIWTGAPAGRGEEGGL